jgi:cyclophilin family peptidyl-prolyl cis-trans isomerase
VDTSLGSFVIQLDEARAPLTVANFLAYVKAGHYDGLVFHRVVDGFVVQGGGYTPDLELRPVEDQVANESGNGLSNRRGTVAMARTGDPHSADSQFYVNLADNVTLDPKPTRWGYAVFGQVVEGMDVVDEIGHRPTTSRGDMSDVPAENIVIRTVRVLAEPVAR